MKLSENSTPKAIVSYIPLKHKSVIYKRRLRVSFDQFKEFIKWYGYKSMKHENWYSNTYFITNRLETEIFCYYFGIEYKPYKTYLRF